MAFSLHRFLKSILIKEEGTLTPKEIEIVPGGSAGTKTTLTSSQTANQTLTLPLGGSDTLVARATADTLTNKTIVAASNTITVAATNVTATALNAALTEIQANVDDHINATPNAHDAPAINVTPTGNLSSSNVQDALEELQTEIDTGATDLANHLSDATDAHDASAISNVPSGNLAATDVQAALNELQADVDTRILSSEKGAVSGVATLDGGGKVPSSQLPASVMQYQGQWNASTNTPTLANGTGSAGDVYEVTVAGSTNFGAGSISFNIGDWAVYDGSVWEKSINSNEVVSVNGLTGAVTLDTDDVAEGSTNLYFTNGRAQTALSSHTSASSGVHGVTGSVVGTTDTQALTNKDVDGGTASNTSRITLPKDTKSNLDGLTRKQGTLVYDTTSNKPYYDDGTLLKPVGSGSGGAKNLITDGEADNVSTSIFTAYADAAATRPVDGTGGSPSVTTSVTSTSPLEGTKSFLLTKDAANRQGQGWSVPFTVDPAYRAKSLKISVDYIVNSGTFVAGGSSTESDVIWYIYDVTNSQLIEPSNIKMFSNNSSISDKFEATFQTSATGASYRLIAHVQSTSTSAYELKVDNVTVSPQTYVFGTPVTDFPTSTSSGSGGLSNITYAYRVKRDGDEAVIEYTGTATGTPTGSILTLTLPIAIDTSKINSTRAILGNGILHDDSASVTYDVAARYNSATEVLLMYKRADVDASDITQAGVTAIAPFSLAVNDVFKVTLRYPALGWSSSVQMSDSADTRVVDAGYLRNGTQSVNTSTDTTVIWNSSRFDSHSAMNSSNGHYVVPVSGDYDVSASVGFQSYTPAAGHVFFLRIQRLNSAGGILEDSYREAFIAQAAVSQEIYLKASGKYRCNAGDQLRIVIFQNSGATRTILSQVAFVDINRISGPSAIAASESVSVAVSSSAGQSILGGDTFNTIQFNTVSYDSHAAWNTTSHRFTAPSTGKYRVSFSATFDYTSWTVGNRAFCFLRRNGTSVRNLDLKWVQASISLELFVTGSAQIDLRAGDYIDLIIIQNSAGAKTLSTGVVPQLQIERVGN